MLWPSGLTPLSLWPQCRRCVVPRANSSRVHCSSSFVQRGLVGALGTPFPSHRGPMHWVSRTPRSERPSPCRLSMNRLRKRATPTERMLARICREAGARFRYSAFLRDMNVHVRPDDERRIEVLAHDLPCFGETQLAVDITL